jgi:hypothetical protein
VIHIATTPTFGKASIAFGARKGDKRLSGMQICQMSKQDDDGVFHAFGGNFTGAA